MHATQRRSDVIQVSAQSLNFSIACWPFFFFKFKSIRRDGERLNIELGRALRSGEFKCKVHYMKLAETIEDNEKIPFLCDWILCNGASVGKTKREILAHIASIDPKYDIPYERCRLRKKNGNCPSKIYLDDQKFGDDVVLLQNLQVSLEQRVD